MYGTAHIDFETVFSGDTWTATAIKTFPMNYTGDVGSNEFVRVGLFPGTGIIQSSGSARVAGFAEVNIFVMTGDGEARAFQIADLLDQQFQFKTHGNTQFLNSNLTKVGVDPVNSALWRIDYRVPFRTSQ